MRIRSWLLLFGLSVAGACADGAHALSFGTSSSVAIDLAGSSSDASSVDSLADVVPTTTSGWLANGATTAAALTPFGANHAAVGSAPGTSAFAASLWTDTFTLTSVLGATGPATLPFRLRLLGTLAAGSTPGGYAQVAHRAEIGLPDPDGALPPATLLASDDLMLDVMCSSEEPGCDASATLVDDALAFDAPVEYGVPFRLSVLLETTAWDGGAADFAPSAWLSGITLPEGARLHAASGWSYDDVITIVPEPSTLLLLGAGLAALARRPRAVRFGT